MGRDIMEIIALLGSITMVALVIKHSSGTAQVIQSAGQTTTNIISTLLQ